MENLDFSQVNSFLASVTERELYVSFNVPANNPDPVRTQIPVSLFMELAALLEPTKNQEERDYRITLIDLAAPPTILGQQFTSRIVTEDLFNMVSAKLSDHLSSALS
jgi:hypothetical protein